jgi:hypothetical protein
MMVALLLSASLIDNRCSSAAMFLRFALANRQQLYDKKTFCCTKRYQTVHHLRLVDARTQQTLSCCFPSTNNQEITVVSSSFDQ